ncbi:MAG: TetR family transcriptional regulator [Planctomycetes bacterium]|nr:TetR family transcriptional regulator [Planctomycetota bacterium]
MSTRDTRERLLDAAEELFAKRGFDAASMRDITSLADANLASVNYHFGSKEALLGEVIRRRAEGIVEDRERMLNLAVEAAGKHPPRARAVIEAFVYPMISTAREHPHFAALMSRVHYEGLFHAVGKVFERTFQNSMVAFVTQLSKALPGIPAEEMRMRLVFTVGAFALIVKQNPMVNTLAKRKTDVCMEEVAGYLVDFCAAGMEAPPNKKRKGGRQ